MQNVLFFKIVSEFSALSIHLFFILSAYKCKFANFFTLLHKKFVRCPLTGGVRSREDRFYWNKRAVLGLSTDIKVYGHRTNNGQMARGGSILFQNLNQNRFWVMKLYFLGKIRGKKFLTQIWVFGSFFASPPPRLFTQPRMGEGVRGWIFYGN